MNLGKKELLYVGIAGDSPGGEYSYLFPGFHIRTLDKDPIWRPDIVADITNTDFHDESFDVIVCVQVIEHIPNLWDLPKELYRILVKDGFCIIDCPWLYPYHAEPGFGDYWRISRDGIQILFGPHFQIIQLVTGEQNTSCLLKKA